MNFDTLCDRLVSLYDVGTTRAAEVANERLARMCAQAENIKALRTNLGPTVANQASYALAVDIVQVYRVRVAYTSGTVTFSGTETLDDIWDLEDGNATVPDGTNFYVIEPDSDATGTTGNLRLYPTPTVAGAAISALVAVIPAVLTYGSETALPIPLDVHEHLLAGCKAELSDEDSRQDESGKWEIVFEAGIKRLSARENSRGKGTDRHRMGVVGYDLRR